MNEAFIYLWYDAPNKKYYLGKHKGTPDDGYTHSSKSSDEFCSIVPDSTRPVSERQEFFENMPKGVSRRILAYGTDEEICILENKLLINRKKRCWNRYYNESLGDPRYVDISGENNPFYGKTHTEEVRKKLSETNSGENSHRWNMPPEEHPNYYHGKAAGTKKNPEKRRIYDRELYQKNIERKREIARESYQRNKHKRTREMKDEMNRKQREYRARKKAERQGEGTLEGFLR